MTLHTYAITKPSTDVARYTWTSGLPDFRVVQIGDYVNITAVSFNVLNRGSFQITALSSIHNGSTGWVNYFEVTNAVAVAQAGPLSIASVNEIQFYRQSRAQLHTIAGREVVIAQGPNGSLDIVLPATTQAVSRDELSAAYIPSRASLVVSSVEVIGSGVATVTTSTAHGLAVGNKVVLDGLYPNTTVPATVAGTLSTAGLTGISGAAQASLWDRIRSDVTTRTDHTATLLSTGDVLICGGWDLTTFLTTCSRFRRVSEAVLGSGAGIGRTQYSYNWIATASFPAVSADHRVTALQGAASGQALRTGGRNSGGTLATAQLYDTTANTWTTVLVGTLTARYNHECVRVIGTAGDDVVYIIGGQLTATTATGNVEKFTRTSGGTLAASALTETLARYGHKATAITANSFVVTGGASFTAGVPVLRGDCWGFNELTSTSILMGNLGIARMEHAAVLLSEGVVMVIGGLGRNLTNESASRVLHECEIWNSTTRVWAPAPRLKFARQKPSAVVLGNKVYVFGGKDSTGALVTDTEVFDIATNKWLGAPTSGDLAVPYGAATSEWNGLLFAQGGVRYPATVDEAYLFIPGLTIGKDCNQTVNVVSVPTTTTFTFSTTTGNYSSLSAGTALPVGATSTSYAGPYIWHPDGDAAITAKRAVLGQALTAGQQYRTITVDNAATFPDAPGWLAFAYGTKSAVYPVPYLGKVSNTVLTLDYNFKFPLDIPLSSDVTLLAQKGPFVPENPEEEGSFYLTGSASGRVAAETLLKESVSGGRELNISVSYPGDKGLGGAGYPVVGPKLSDVVMIWGGDDLDAELEAAREDEE